MGQHLIVAILLNDWQHIHAGHHVNCYGLKHIILSLCGYGFSIINAFVSIFCYHKILQITKKCCTLSIIGGIWFHVEIIFCEFQLQQFLL